MLRLGNYIDQAFVPSSAKNCMAYNNELKMLNPADLAFFGKAANYLPGAKIACRTILSNRLTYLRRPARLTTASL